MYNEKSISVVIPTFNDGKLLNDTLRGMPSYVDNIIVVNDGSEEETSNIILECSETDNRISCINHKKNMGLGQSLIDGYLYAREIKSDITAVMAGDNQMAPNDLENVIKPIAHNKFDYVKGNRLCIQKNATLQIRW